LARKSIPINISDMMDDDIRDIGDGTEASVQWNGRGVVRCNSNSISKMREGSSN
jgi:hypothetical protein